jgi:hypothetical protein
MSENVNSELNTNEAVKKHTNYGITREQFVETWEKSATVQEVADKLTELSRKGKFIGADDVVPKGIVNARATMLRRKLNVKLKSMRSTTGRKDDGKSLNQLVEKIRSETQTVAE